MITFSKFTLFEIHKWTDSNFHTISQAYVSRMMGEFDLAKKFMAIQKRQENAGYLTDELYEERKILSKEMQSIGNAKVSNWNTVNQFL
tara:strand:+ start:267 stop:530 length:264 start_codon:yes stop_codon:yes gene_type:complete